MHYVRSIRRTMERRKCVDLHDVVGKGSKARLGFALDFVDVIGKLRAHKLGEVHVEPVGFSMI